MLSIINPFQGAFFAGRSAHDNIAMAQELMHSIRNSKKRHGNLAIVRSQSTADTILAK